MIDAQRTTESPRGDSTTETHRWQLGPDHWVELTLSKPLDERSFEKLRRYLELVEPEPVPRVIVTGPMSDHIVGRVVGRKLDGVGAYGGPNGSDGVNTTDNSERAAAASQFAVGMPCLHCGRYANEHPPTACGSSDDFISKMAGNR